MIRLKRISTLAGLLFVFSISNIASSAPIFIEIFPSNVSSLNYQLYYNGEKYVNKVDFELTNLDTGEKIHLSSKRSYLYLKGISLGNYNLKTKSLKFVKSYHIEIDEDHVDTANETKIINLDLFDRDTHNPSEVVENEEQLFPLINNPNFPEISDVNDSDNPDDSNNTGSGSGNSIFEWIDDIFHSEFDFRLLPGGSNPSIGGSDDDSILDPNYHGNLPENGGGLDNDNSNSDNSNSSIENQDGLIINPNDPGYRPVVEDSITIIGDKFNIYDYLDKNYKIDENGILLRPDGTPVISNGHRVDLNGMIVDDNNNPIIVDGYNVNINGLLVEANGDLVISNGYYVDMNGFIVNYCGNFVIVAGNKVNKSGLVVDNNGNPIKVNGYYVNIDGLLSSSDSNPIMINGYRVNHKGLLVNKNNSLVIKDGYYININGLLVNKDESFLTVNGYYVNSNFLLVHSNGELLVINGMNIDKDGFLINSSGERVDLNGNLSDSDGNLIDDSGNLILDESGNPVVAVKPTIENLYGENGVPIIKEDSPILQGNSSFDNTDSLDDLLGINEEDEFISLVYENPNYLKLAVFTICVIVLVGSLWYALKYKERWV